MKSPLRYPGGKTRAIKILEKYIPAGTRKLCSPFFGGGSFELFLEEKGIEIFAADNFLPLVNFWNNQHFGLWTYVDYYFENMDKVLFYDLQSRIMHENDPIKQGAMFYALNRCSFSGSTLSGGMSIGTKRFTRKSVEAIDRTKHGIPFKLKNESFEVFIPKHDCLVFADPPYYIGQKLYGNKGNMHKGFDHKLLYEILIKRGNFILSYNDCDYIRNLYKGCKFDIVQWSYGMNKSKKSNEVIITPL